MSPWDRSLWIHVRISDIGAEDREVLVSLMQAAQMLWSRNLMTIWLDQAGAVAYGFSLIPAVNLNLARLKETSISMLKTAAELRRRIRERDFTLFADASAPDDVRWRGTADRV